MQQSECGLGPDLVQHHMHGQSIHRPDEEPDLSLASSCHASTRPSHSNARKCVRNRSAPASPTAAIHGKWNGELSRGHTP